MQTRSPLCICHGLNWAYAPRLRKQFCVKNIKQSLILKKNRRLEVTFATQKLKSCRILEET